MNISPSSFRAHIAFVLSLLPAIALADDAAVCVIDQKALIKRDAGGNLSTVGLPTWYCPGITPARSSIPDIYARGYRVVATFSSAVSTGATSTPESSRPIDLRTQSTQSPPGMEQTTFLVIEPRVAVAPVSIESVKSVVPVRLDSPNPVPVIAR